MARTEVRQSQIYNTGITIQDYYDNLSNQLVSANNPEIDSGVTLVTSESMTFSASGSVVTLSTSNPQTQGVVPGDDITITGSTSDDGTYEITDVSAGTVTVSYTFTAGDGGSATGIIRSVRDVATDLNFLRGQLRKILGITDWYLDPSSGSSPILTNKKVIYQIENNTDILVPTAGFADISALGLTPYADQSISANEGILASTSLPTAGGGYKSEGKHWVDIVNAATGDPITISGNRVYGYIVVDSIATPTTEEVYFVYFNNSSDAEVLVTNLSTQQDVNTATNFEITYNTRANLSSIPEDFGLAPNHSEAAVDQWPTLQQAYVRGNTITLSDAEGDLVITLDDAGADANFQVTDSGGDYILTDASTNKLSLGSAANAVDINATTNVTGTNTFTTGTGQVTHGGNVDANAGLDVIGTTNLGDGGVTNYAQFNPTGDLDFKGTADTISKSDGTLNIQTTTDNLTLQTITSGILALLSAGALDMDAVSATLDTTGAFSIDAAASSNVSVTGANLTLSSITSGNVVLDSAGLLTFNDSFWTGVGSVDPLPFSDATNPTFTGSATGAVSLIDAINQVAAQAGDTMAQADTTAASTPRDTDFTLPGALFWTTAAEFVADFIIFVNGVKMRNGLNSAANFDVYPGSTGTTVRFEFKVNTNDTVSAVKIA